MFQFSCKPSEIIDKYIQNWVKILKKRKRSLNNSLFNQKITNSAIQLLIILKFAMLLQAKTK